MTADLGKARETPKDIEAIFDRLCPLLRSLTGEGARSTLDILSELHSLERIEIPSGPRVFDWTVLEEWRVGSAYLVAPDGRRLADFHKNNLHLVGYSHPFRGRLGLSDLLLHLHSLPQQPDVIPYRTTYYEPRWGFCMSDRLRRSLPPGDYNIVVDTRSFKARLPSAKRCYPAKAARKSTCRPTPAIRPSPTMSSPGLWPLAFSCADLR